MRRLAPLVTLALGLLLPQAAAAQEIIVKHERGTSRAERKDVRADAGVRLVERPPLPRTELVRAPGGDVASALDRLNADPDVVYAEPDRVRSAVATSDTHWDKLWAFENAGQELLGFTGTPDSDADVLEAWDLVADPGTGITVAVVDTGVRLDHEDLAGQFVPGDPEIPAGEDDGSGWDFVDADDDPTDEHGHGTHVAGTIAAVRDNGTGVAGVAPSARILPVRVLAADGSGWDSDIAAGFDYAAANGAQIVNASLGGAGLSDTLSDAIGRHPDVLFVVAAGNDGADNDVTPYSPCNEPQPNIVCVGASDASDAPACFSNYGATTVDLFAPGVNIASAALGGGYAWSDGTSMATPLVAGIAALLRQADPDPESVRAQLIASVDPKAAMAPYSVAGGRVNALRALGGAETGSGGGDGICDSDGDGIEDQADACPDEAGAESEDGCPIPDSDGDGILDPDDDCPTVAAPGTADGCPPPAPTSDPPPPAPKTTPPPAPKPAPRPAPKPAPPPDRDRDGRPDATDACPTEPAATANGCPVPALAKGSARVRRRVARLRFKTDRAATLKVSVKRRKCKRNRCRWVRVKRRTLSAQDGTARLKLKRLKRGRHRARVAPTSPAGDGRTRTLRFRVR